MLKNKLALVKNAFLEVFSKHKYIAVFVLTFLLVFFLSLWLPNLSLLYSFLSFENVSLSEKFSFLLSSALLLKTNLTFFSAIFLLVEILLFAFNVAFLAYYFKYKKALLDSSASIGGIISGFLGVGCASCGSIVLSLLGFSGAALLLPFGGQEFSVLSIFLLTLSLFILSKRISQKTCKI